MLGIQKNWILELKSILLMLLVLTVCQSQLWAKFYQSTRLVGASSSHEITVQFKNLQIPMGSYLQIQYSSAWGVASVAGGNLTSDFCETGCSISGVQTFRDSVARTVQIKNLFPRLITTVESRAIRYTLNNLVNPAYSMTSESVGVTLFDNTNLIIDSNSAVVSIQAKQIVCSCSRSSTTVSALTDYQFTIASSPLTLPSNLNIMMFFPSIWSSSSETGTYANATCSSTLNPSIACVLTNGIFNLTNVLVANTSTAFTFTISNIRNPGSEEYNNQLIFQFFTSSSRQIAYCTVPITGTTAKTLPDLSFSLSGSIGSLSTAVMSFTITEKPKTTDIVQIELPKQYGCSKLYAAFVHLGTELIGTQATLNINSTASATTLVSLQPFFSDSIELYRIKLFQIQIPKTSAPIPQIKLSIFRNGALVASQSCCSASFPILQSLQGMSVTLSTTLVGSWATHFITIDAPSALSFPNDYAFLLLQLDAKYSLSNPTFTCYIEKSSSIVDNPICTLNSSSSILVSSFNSSNRIGNATFTIGIYSILTPVTLSPLALSVVTLDANYYGIESLTTSYTLSATKINSVLVTPSLLSAYTTCSYMFSINNTNALSVRTIAIIHFPSEVQIGSASLCYLNGTQLTAADCIVDNSNLSSHKARIGLGNTLVIGAMQLANTNITVSGVANPLSVRQSATFGVQLTSSIGQIIEELKEGIFVTMNSPAGSFSYLRITATDNHTMSISDYHVEYRLPVDVMQNYGVNSSLVAGGVKVVMVLPPQFSCSGTINPCMVQGERESLTFTMSSTSANATYLFIVASVGNPRVSSISSSIIVRLYLSNYLSIQQVYNALSSFEPTLISYTFSQSNYFLAERSKVFLTLSAMSTWLSSNSTTFLRVAPPPQYSIDGSETISCNQAGAVISKSVSTSSNISYLQQVRIDNISSASDLILNIADIFNPSALPVTTGWALELGDTATGGIIARSNQSTDATFSLLCTLPCRSCVSSNSSACLSCYSSLSGITQKYLDPDAYACRASCLWNQFLPFNSSDFTCETCSTQCEQCSNISQNCTSCPAGRYLYLPISKCLLQCPPQYYNDVPTRQCTLCPSPCLHCSGSAGLTCTLCQSSLLLTAYFNGSTTCTSQCPPTYFNNSNICTQCPNCANCSSASSCTLCANGFYLYNGTCLSECPSGYYLSIASGLQSCEVCQLPCLTCSGYSTYCLTCNTSSILINKYLYTTLNSSICTNGCPLNFYFTEDLICQPCIPPCLSCSSPTSCSSCVPTYYFHSNTQACYLTCPNTTLALSSPFRCQQCALPCLECAGAIDSCSSCVEGYFLDTQLNVCNLTCSLPFFGIRRKCARCEEPCATCANMEVTVCTTCVGGYLLLGTTCYLSCPDGSFKISPSACSLCTSGCLTCTNSSSTCLSCYPGLYLYQHMCLPSCPTNPIFYYQYQMQCIPCQPQCTTCISSPVECASCSDSNFFFNEITRECTSGCTTPYYPAIGPSNTKVCLKCRLPCKTCLNSYTQCATCHNGFYLYNAQCVRNCSGSNYADSDLNLCVPCSTHCLTCVSLSTCTQCESGAYFFQGTCFVNCPPAAQYIYLGKYCRNCVLENCLLCDDESLSEQSCLLCEPGFYLYGKRCQANCPEGYEADSVTKSLCIVSQASALISYFQKLQKFKAYVMPGTGILFISCLLLWIYLCERQEVNLCPAPIQLRVQNTLIVKLNAALALLAIPQSLSLVCYFIYFVLNFETSHHSSLLNFAYYALFACFYAFNTIQFFLVLLPMRTDLLFVAWKNRSPKNSSRFTIVMVNALLLNKKMFFLLFSGVWKIPATSCQVSASTLQVLSKRLKIVCFFSIVFVEIPILICTIYLLLVEGYLFTNYRLFYGTLDIAAISALCVVAEIVLVATGLSSPGSYKKYILENVSNRSAVAWSDKIMEQPQEDDQPNLHRSNSAEGIHKQSEEMRAIQYKSVFDTIDFEDPDYVEPFKLQIALNQGKFRKKNLKRKHNKGRNLQLDVIDEDSSQSEENQGKKAKKQQKIKKNKVGYMKNYIYWKPPQKTEKKVPEKQFKMHEKQIMQTIRQKESDFDTITRNQFIFQEHGSGQNSSHDSDPNFEIEDSRRALNFQYETFLNKNYAKRRHLK